MRRSHHPSLPFRRRSPTLTSTLANPYTGTSIPTRVYMAVTDLVWAPISGARQAVSSVAWGPLVDLSRSLVLSLLKKVQVGQLRIVDENGHLTICGKEDVPADEPQTELRVHKDTFWVRMLLFTDMVRCKTPPLQPKRSCCSDACLGIRGKLHARRGLVS